MASPTLHGAWGRTEEQRFFDMVQITDTCWLWVGAVKANGYGCFAIKRGAKWTKANAHRYSYELHVGPIPDGYEVDHLCHVRNCVNPAHLESVTLQENRLRRDERRTHCPNGHPRTPDNLYVDPKTGWKSCMTCRQNHKRRAA